MFTPAHHPATADASLQLPAALVFTPPQAPHPMWAPCRTSPEQSLPVHSLALQSGQQPALSPFAIACDKQWPAASLPCSRPRPPPVSPSEQACAALDWCVGWKRLAEEQGCATSSCSDSGALCSTGSDSTTPSLGSPARKRRHFSHACGMPPLTG